MTIPVLICDDSALARKQMARTLPKDWDVEVTFATNGAEGLDDGKNGERIRVLLLVLGGVTGGRCLQQVRCTRGEFAKMHSINGGTRPVFPEVLEEEHEEVDGLVGLDELQSDHLLEEDADRPDHKNNRHDPHHHVLSSCSIVCSI